MIRGWLSRTRDGRYLLTKFEPTLAYVGLTNERDYYISTKEIRGRLIGDPIGYRFICQYFVSGVWEVELEPLEKIRVIIPEGTVFGRQTTSQETQQDIGTSQGGQGDQTPETGDQSGEGA